MPTPKPAVFLDRDDTLIANAELDWSGAAPPLRPGDLCDPDRVRLLPGALDACRRLAHAGFTLVVVTNQALVGLGGGTIDDVHRTHDRLRALLVDSEGRGLLSGCYFATHHPDAPQSHAQGAFRGDHAWRKPSPGMILAAARELRLDLATSWLVGDAKRDLDAARAAGLAPDRCLRIGPGAPNANLTTAAAQILSSTCP
ncbi:MAG: HAD-IIIA family hydrolase, partial [Planctomycetota bacterium]